MAGTVAGIHTVIIVMATAILTVMPILMGMDMGLGLRQPRQRLWR